MQAQPWRVNLTQNALAQTFCDQAYQNNPAFLAFLQRSGLLFQSESEFTPEVLERRNLLCGRVGRTPSPHPLRHGAPEAGAGSAAAATGRSGAPARAHEPRPPPGHPAGGCQRLSGDLLHLLTPLRQALERIERKAMPLLATPALLDSEEGQDRLDVICMQFLAAGEALKRLEKLHPGLLMTNYPDIDWKGAMGFRDVIAHQYFDLDSEQVLLICQEALPGLLSAIRALEADCSETA